MDFKLKATVLDKKLIDNHIWIMCKVNLFDYLKLLKPEFYNFAIQRRIVKNQYLDNLFQTVKSKDPIPPITITENLNGNLPKAYYETIGLNYDINMSKTEILDGLQRTFRLWGYYQLGVFYEQDFNNNPRLFDDLPNTTLIVNGLRKKCDVLFDAGIMSHKIINGLVNDLGSLNDIFRSYEIYLTIWIGLSEREIIQKMLLLNAGHKPMSKTHQFELLFLQFYDRLKNESRITLIKENDSKSIEIKNENRQLGFFLFSSVIIALQSLIEGKPVRVSTEKLIDSEFKEETNSLVYNKIFNFEFLLWFLNNCVFKIDEAIFDTKDVDSIKWFAKDTSLSGFFGAIGNDIDFNNDADKIGNILEEKIVFLIEYIKGGGLKISDFTAEYKNLSSMSINIGTVIRNVISGHFQEVLQGKNPYWKQSFNSYNLKNRNHE